MKKVNLFSATLFVGEAHGKYVTPLLLIFFLVLLLPACSGNTTSGSKTVTPGANKQLIDTAKLKSDMNDILNSITSQKPDTNKLKQVAHDILSADAFILSDSAIDKLYGNSNDPAVNTAKEMVKKMRNKLGITPAQLDSIKKVAESLESNGSQHH